MYVGLRNQRSCAYGLDDGDCIVQKLITYRGTSWWDGRVDGVPSLGEREVMDDAVLVLELLRDKTKR